MLAFYINKFEIEVNFCHNAVSNKLFKTIALKTHM